MCMTVFVPDLRTKPLRVPAIQKKKRFKNNTSRQIVTGNNITYSKRTEKLNVHKC